MTPKDKAKHLFDKYYAELYQISVPKQFKQAKQCAVIAADQILAFIGEENWSDPSWEYWQQVKAEIEKL